MIIRNVALRILRTLCPVFDVYPVLPYKFSFTLQRIFGSEWAHPFDVPAGSAGSILGALTDSALPKTQMSLLLLASSNQ